MALNVLGAEYTVIICQETECERLKDCDGFCDETTKEIVVENFDNLKNDPSKKKNLDVQVKKTIRHEVVHAFLFESGLAENSYWAQNEELVDWIAIQGPKIYKAWQEAGAL